MEQSFFRDQQYYLRDLRAADFSVIVIIREMFSVFFLCASAARRKSSLFKNNKRCGAKKKKKFNKKFSSFEKWDFQYYNINLFYVRRPHLFLRIIYSNIS